MVINLILKVFIRRRRSLIYQILMQLLNWNYSFIKNQAVLKIKMVKL
nr:MAG TPA: hypothetical protein [Caudoviricetes sp.]